ncbi:hypothetical protein RJT00_15795 [Segatella copri]|uniref:hypothetical protein n=1 Tax=Segatella copri TaxID=165179 RepID=UPI00293A5BDA|nr:hypothetical protein [Segatella copri]MDV3114792.1 hypothetical protein [Segatella copri]
MEEGKICVICEICVTLKTSCSKKTKSVGSKNDFCVRFSFQTIKYKPKSENNPLKIWWFHEKIVTLQPFNQKDKKEYIE